MMNDLVRLLKKLCRTSSILHIMPLNFEFKARTTQLYFLEERLLSLNPRFIGEDFQTDTYFNTGDGRLKLREGNIENALIHYNRNNIASAKSSEVLLYQHRSDPALKLILERSFGIKVVVQKKRRIYFIDNVKFHFDEVKQLGSFVEVEAIDEDGSIGIENLNAQCQYYADFFGIKPTDYISESYSDMLLNEFEN
jgi:adenylate cyclase, class 2